MSAPIAVDDVCKTFSPPGRPVTHALTEISLDIAGGEFVAVVGASGCGKTTLLRLLAGLEDATEGSLSIGGELVSGPSWETSLMFQSPNLLPWRSILDNVLLPVDISRKVQKEDRDKARSLLVNVGLGDFEDRYPHELSGGMQQRAAICRALISSPGVLLLDEPFGALDAMTRDQMNLDLNDIWRRQGTTTVLITHSISEAVFLAQRVIVMSPRPGRIIDIIDVPLPDNRTTNLMGTPEFTETAARVRRHFADGEQTVGAIE